MSYVGSYVWRLREKWGPDELLLPGVGVLVFNTNGQVLLGKRTDFNVWCHIGGSAEVGQTAEETARRELEEECGLTNVGDIKAFAMLSEREHLYREYPPSGDKFSCWSLCCYVTGIAPDAVMPGDDEHSTFAWFDLDKLPESLFMETPHVIAAWKEFQKTGQFVLR